jgi:hypothetical protein
MKTFTAFIFALCAMVLIAAMVCFTVLTVQSMRNDTMLELQRRSSPILQIIPMPGSDDSEPDRPDVWREQHHKKGTM